MPGVGRPPQADREKKTPMATTSVRNDSDAMRRERALSMIGGLLGLAMFILGFVRWLEVGDGDQAQKYSGYAFGMPTTAVIGFSIAAGLIAVLGATETRRRRGVPSAIPAGLAGTSLLLAIGVWLGKGSISPVLGSKVGVQAGMILGVIVAALQTIVLGLLLAHRHDDDILEFGDTRSGTTASRS